MTAQGMAVASISPGAIRDRWVTRLGALAGVAGVVLEIAMGALHVGHSDPNNSGAVFAEYGESGIWTMVHIGQFAGAMLVAIALLALARSLANEDGLARALALLGALATLLSISIFAVQMAVDGVALKATIDAWLATQEPIARAAAFFVADGVRWIEKALSAFFHLNNGAAFLALGIAVATGHTFVRWLGLFGAAAGLGALAGGVVAAHTGFSAESASILGPSSLAGAAFLGGCCVSMWRNSFGRYAAAPAAPTPSLA